MVDTKLTDEADRHLGRLVNSKAVHIVALTPDIPLKYKVLLRPQRSATT